MLKGKFRADKIPVHLKNYVQGGTIYPIIDQSDIIFIKTELALIPFRADQIERPGEKKPEALVELNTVEEFISMLLSNFEMSESGEAFDY
jgi:hypothetical protein